VRYNVAPGQKVLVVPNIQPRIFDYYTWGLVPHWAKDPTIGSKIINARAETVFEKPSFRGPIRSQRCLVPADGFYEWKRTAGQSIPFRIFLKGKRLFSFAAIFDIWKEPQGDELRTFSLITTGANKLVGKIHDRMPVILDEKKEQEWLDPKLEEREVEKLLVPFPSKKMEMHQISKTVNNPKNDNPVIIQPVKGKE